MNSNLLDAIWSASLWIALLGAGYSWLAAKREWFMYPAYNQAALVKSWPNVDCKCPEVLMACM